MSRVHGLCLGLLVLPPLVLLGGPLLGLSSLVPFGQEGSKDAVLWDANEWHDVGTDDGMVGFLVESPEMDPESFMPERQRTNGSE